MLDKLFAPCQMTPNTALPKSRSRRVVIDPADLTSRLTCPPSSLKLCMKLCMSLAYTRPRYTMRGPFVRDDLLACGGKHEDPILSSLARPFLPLLEVPREGNLFQDGVRAGRRLNGGSVRTRYATNELQQ